MEFWSHSRLEWVRSMIPYQASTSTRGLFLCHEGHCNLHSQRRMQLQPTCVCACQCQPLIDWLIRIDSSFGEEDIPCWKTLNTPCTIIAIPYCILPYFTIYNSKEYPSPFLSLQVVAFWAIPITHIGVYPKIWWWWWRIHLCSLSLLLLPLQSFLTNSLCYKNGGSQPFCECHQAYRETSGEGVFEMASFPMHVSRVLTESWRKTSAIPSEETGTRFTEVSNAEDTTETSPPSGLVHSQ